MLRSLLFLLASFPLLLTGCPTNLDDDDSASDDDDSASDDDDSVAENTCAPAATIACGGAVSGTTVGAANNFDSYGCSEFDTNGPEAYFEFTATSDEPVLITMTPGAEDLDLFVLNADGLGNCDGDDCAGSSQDTGTEAILFDVTAGTTYTIVVDGYDGAEDSFDLSLECSPAPPVDYVYVAVRSRTSTAADLDNNTPGPDIDAVEIFNLDGSSWATEIWATPGELGANGSVNEDPDAVLGEDDAFEANGDCILDDDTMDARFYSMGGGDPLLGDEGWLVVSFEDGVSVVDGDVVGVYEVGADDCANISTERDDEYEVYICNSDFDPDNATLLDLEGDTCVSLGETGTGGGITDFDVSLAR